MNIKAEAGAPLTPDTFSRAFAGAFSRRDAAGMAALFAEDADLLTLTGHWAEGREAIVAALSAEFTGALQSARLVTGKQVLRRPAEGVALVAQRFVLSGASGADGTDIPRLGILMQATLAEAAGWRALSASMAGLTD